MLPSNHKKIALLMLSVAGLLKFIVYLQNRCLFLDEINLSRNIVEKSYPALFRALDYQQFSPPLYAVVVKFFTQLFGVSEYSLRLFSLLLGFGALYLFYQLSLRLFKNAGVLYAAALFGFSIFMLRYHTENKQYGADVFFALLFLYLPLKYQFADFREYIVLGAAGAISIWFSMPLVFVLTGTGCYLFYEKVWKEKNPNIDKRKVAAILLMIGMWLLSFGLLFLVNLKTSINSKYLQDYHEIAYLELPTSIAAIQQSYAVLRDLISSMVGPRPMILFWAPVCMLLGFWQLLRFSFSKSILIVFPVLSCFFASMLHQYILIPRVALFLMPIFFLLIGLGAGWIYEQIIGWRKPFNYLSLIVILIPIGYSIVGRTAVQYFVEPYTLENPRDVLKELSTHPNNTLPTYVTHYGVPAYKFYTQQYEPAIDIPTLSVQYGTWSDQLPALSKKWKEEGIEKIWIFDSHTFGDDLVKLQSEIKSVGDVEVLLTKEFGDAYLLRLN